MSWTNFENKTLKFFDPVLTFLRKFLPFLWIIYTETKIQFQGKSWRIKFNLILQSWNNVGSTPFHKSVRLNLLRSDEELHFSHFYILLIFVSKSFILTVYLSKLSSELAVCCSEAELKVQTCPWKLCKLHWWKDGKVKKILRYK